MSALTLFEILKFNEPIRTSAIDDLLPFPPSLFLCLFLLVSHGLALALCLCARSTEARKRDVRGGRENEKRDTEREVLFVIRLTYPPFVPLNLRQIKSVHPSCSYNRRSATRSGGLDASLSCGSRVTQNFPISRRSIAITHCRPWVAKQLHAQLRPILRFDSLLVGANVT